MLTMTSSLWAEMIRHVQSAYPAEGCGFLAGQHGRVQQVYPIQNLQHSSTAFLMNPVQQVRAWYALHRAGQTLLAIYHSHPHTAAWPSAQDQADLSFPEVLQVIVSLREYDQPQVRAFWLAPAVQEVTIRLENASK